MVLMFRALLVKVFGNLFLLIFVELDAGNCVCYKAIKAEYYASIELVFLGIRWL